MSAADTYCELGVASNFSFLRGASHPEELAVTARRLGLAGLAICDRNTVAGVVRTHMAAKEADLAFRPGCRLVFADGTPDCLVWPKTLAGWKRLCRLLTLGNCRAQKGDCRLSLADLLDHGEGLAMALAPASALADAAATAAALAALAAAFPGAVRLALTPGFGPAGQRECVARAALARSAGVEPVATNEVLYHRPQRRQLADVVACIREHVTLEEAGRRLEAHAERHLKSGTEMARLLRDYPGAIAETARLFGELSFSLEELRYQYPDEQPQSGLSCQEELARLARQGAAARYPDGVPHKVLAQIEHELRLIAELQYAPYFLTVHDIVRFARSKSILCQGRGSAANSTICYCIGITDVDPSLTDLLFERFISPERREPPDIDVDFEHERREEVIQYIYAKYGRERAGLAATVITYRARSAAREIGKVFGLSQDAIGALSGAVWGHHAASLGEREACDSGLDMTDPAVSRVIELATEINGFPRHLSQHVGGFVITRDRLDEIIPVMNTAMEDRTQVEWDKDDLESLGILKIDILALGMLTCLRKAFDLLADHYGERLTLASMEKEDPHTYAMIQRADTVGTFQIESRAQMSMLPRLKPREFYDLVIEVAIVRPGPIQGDMVHPYLRRRQGKEKVSYPSRELEEVLGRTLGVPLFQEQAMKIAIVAAGFSPGEADKLRRAMATFRRVGTIHSFQTKMVEGMAARGYDREFAERCFRQIEGFGEYGFPESHAASFALLVYASCWLKCHYPDVFCAAILNAQPMGFYAPSQLVRDAREHGVETRPADINLSGYDNSLERGDGDRAEFGRRLHPRHRHMTGDIRARHAVRLGLRQIKGVGEKEAGILMAARGQGYESVRHLWLRTGLSRGTIERLADADAFRSIGLDRRAALWQVKALDPPGIATDLALFAHAGRARPGDDSVREASVQLPVMPNSEHVIQDYRYLSLSLKGHPVAFIRDQLSARGIVASRDLETLGNGRRVSVCGLVVIRQRPGSAKGVVFMTLEDETGIANAIVWPKVMERYRPVVMGARLVIIHGQVQKADGVTHVVARRLENATPLLAALTEAAQAGTEKNPDAGGLDDMGGLANGDEVKRPVMESRAKGKLRNALKALMAQEPALRQDIERLARTASKVMPKGRNFH
jgi:DNA-directed DNA polymerase III PolC